MPVRDFTIDYDFGDRLGQALLISEQIRNARMNREQSKFEMERKREEQQRAARLSELTAPAAMELDQNMLEGPGLAALSKEFPIQAIELKRQAETQSLDTQQKRQSLETGQQEAQNKRALQESQALLPIVENMMKLNPQQDPQGYQAAWNQSKMTAAQLHSRRLISDETAQQIAGMEAPPPEALAQLRDSMSAQLQALRGPESQRAEISSIGMQAADALGLPYDQAKNDSRFQAYVDKLLKDRAKGQSVNINVSTGTKQDLESEFINVDKNLMAFQDLRDLATVPGSRTAENPQGVQDYAQFLSLPSKLGFAARKFGDVIAPDTAREISMAIGGKEGEEWFRRASDFKATLGKFRSEEFKRLLGSAQSKQEIENLVDAILNDKMSPGQFDTAIRRLIQNGERTQQIAQSILSTGNVVAGSAEYRRLFAEKEREMRQTGSGGRREPPPKKVKPGEIQHGVPFDDQPHVQESSGVDNVNLPNINDLIERRVKEGKMTPEEAEAARLGAGAR